MKTMILMGLVWMVVGAAGEVEAAGKTIVNLTTSNVVAVPSVDSLSTSAYLVQFEIPQGIQTVKAAWLELRVDVSSQEVSGFRDPAPLFEVYALSQEPNGEIGPGMFRQPRLPLSRPVAVGENRLVRVDVTDVVRDILANPTINHGLAIGSLTGEHRGMFSLRTDGFGPGTAARISIIE